MPNSHCGIIGLDLRHSSVLGLCLGLVIALLLGFALRLCFSDARFSSIVERQVLQVSSIFACHALRDERILLGPIARLGNQTKCLCKYRMVLNTSIDVCD
jgi:NhaP-type Na+/H+ or K+/H+ antiporter